jgi:quercetin dioxygenase-like cupin family protein
MSAADRSSAATGSFRSLPSDEPFPGVGRRSLTTRRATVSHYTFGAGATFPLHSHPQEQVTLVQSGSVEMTIGDERLQLGAGGWAVVEPEVAHGITAGAFGATVLAIVSPPRGAPDDFELADGVRR